MPKRAKGLSAAFCSTVKTAGKFSDGLGLMLIVSEGGAKRWGQRIVVRGKRKDLGLGVFPAVSLAQARQVAAENHRIARAGQDPLAARDRARAVPTFAVAMSQMLEKKADELRNPKHLAQWESTLRQHAIPAFGDRAVSEISVQDVLDVLRPIWTSTNETASRLRGRIEAVLAYSTAHGWRTGPNPATWGGNLDMLLAKPSKVKTVRHHPALAVEDAPAWFCDLRRRKGPAAQCQEFLAMTWVRSGEARGATWSEIDLERSIWRIPAARTKTAEEHIVPLSAAAKSLLLNLNRQVETDLVFPAPRGGELSDMALSAVMRRMHGSRMENDLELIRFGRMTLSESEAGWLDPHSGRPAVPHGLRSTARNWAGRGGYPRELAELALGHRVGNKVEQAYHRESLVERRRSMMEAWSHHLMTGQLSRPDINQRIDVGLQAAR